MQQPLSQQESLFEEIASRNNANRDSKLSCDNRRIKQNLSQIIGFAYNSVPFYKQFWSQVKNDLINSPSLAKLQQFPLVNRKHISKQLLDLCADDIPSRRVFRHRTSGTTGLPVTALVDEREWHSNLAFIASQINNLGIPVLDQSYGQWCYMQINSYPVRKSVEIATPLPNQPIWRRLNVPSVNSDEAKLHSIEGYLTVLQENSTVVINGMPTVLRYVGQLLRRLYGNSFPKPQMIVASGEQLDEVARDSLEYLFDAPVYNLYASGEVGCVAIECKQRNGLHIDTRRLVVEKVCQEKRTSNTEPHEIVATTLTNYAMPLIRYKTGDYGKITTADCPCGDTRPRLNSLIGHASVEYQQLLAHTYNEPLWCA